MKHLLTISLLLFSFCSFGQVPDSTWKIDTIRCSPGYSWMPTLSTSSLRIVADTCLPDSICEKLWLTFAENMCGEGGFLLADGNYSYHRSSVWSDSLKTCISKEIYNKKVNDKWVEISKCEYYMVKKSTSTCGVASAVSHKEVPCCGHEHPPGDWKTIIVDK